MFIKVVANTLTVLAIVGLLFVVQFVAPDIEAKYFPVITDQTPVVDRTTDGVRFSLTLHKVRACRIESLTWEITDESGGIESRAPITVRTLTTGTEVVPGLVYPPGVLHNGPFEAKLPESFDGADSIIGHIEYRCHPFWTTPQVYGPFPIPTP